MKPLMIAAAALALGSASAATQFPPVVQPGTRVRVWIPEPQAQEHGPWRRQPVRATVTAVHHDTLRLEVPGTTGGIAVFRADIRRLDVSRGTSRVASGFERAMVFAMTGALAAAIENDPRSNEWPNYRSGWRAAEVGGKWGAAIGLVVGLAFPTERWRRIALMK
jgi:hypothetical protein